MHSPAFLSAAIVLALARVARSATFMDALSTNPDYSDFKQLVTQDNAIMDMITGGQSKTVFVPTNNALKQANIPTLDITQKQALVRYHVLNGTFNSEAMSIAGGKTLPTYLQSKDFVSLNGDPNVVFVSKYGSNGLDTNSNALSVYTGAGGDSKVTDPNKPFDQGLIHGVDKVLVTPKTCSNTAKIAGLNSLLTALSRTNLTNFLDTTPRITCFAPSDKAFADANNADTKLSPEDLAKALQHHTLQGDFIGYSDMFKDGGEYQTLQGEKILVTKKDGNLLINGVKVSQANVITSNGVAHVLEGVLPMRGNTTQTNGTAPTSTGTPKPPTATPSQKAMAVGMGPSFLGIVGSLGLGIVVAGFL